MNEQQALTPWRAVRPLSPECCRELRRRAMFQCCKWDPQVEDVDTLAPMVVVLKRSSWRELSVAAEALARETILLEQALCRRPDLHRALALPRRIRRVLWLSADKLDSARHPRVMRFDFHPTAQGWRVSEVNSDVPGGYNEASGWTTLVTEYVPDGEPTGDPAGCLAEEILQSIPAGGTVALVHATAYTDDHQVMKFLARRFQQRGLKPVLTAPDHLHWHDGHALLKCDWHVGPAHLVFRFFPAEWLPNLGRQVKWPCFFGDTSTPLCNPATALLTQSKRWPLVLDDLGLEMPCWERLLPETLDPREADWENDPNWVVKPALGRVGELLGLAGVTTRREWKTIHRSVRWGARHWVAQRRFDPTPLRLNGQAWHICFGVYTINGRAAGIYGRIAPQPLINHLARDVAVLVEPFPTDPGVSQACSSYESLRAL
jgi:glutathionylspermidine synthase